MSRRTLPERPARESAALALVSMVASLTLLGAVLSLFARAGAPVDPLLAQAAPASAASATAARRSAPPG